MDCKVPIHLFVLVTLGCHCLCGGKLIMKPRDTDVKVNHSTFFNCSTDHASTANFWFHGSKFVYTGNAILEPYHERYEVDRSEWNRTYIYNLIIHSVQPSDAGQYICAEDEGVGEKYSVQLVVLDADPICRSNVELHEVIGQNTCNVEPDEVELSCSGTYHGNIHPQLEWKKSGDDQISSDGSPSVTSSNQYNYILKLKGDISLGNSSYICETKRIAQGSSKCILKAINVLYALGDDATVNRSIHDEILCHANTTQPCNYTWRWFQNNDVTTESSSAILKPQKTGLHKCEAECYLRSETCNLLAMRAMVYGDANAVLGSGYVALIAIAVVLTVCVLIIVLLYVFRKRHLNNLGNGRTEDFPMSEFETVDVMDINEIPKLHTKMPFIVIGSSGEIYGPFVFRDINCACEKILLPPSKVGLPPSTEAEVSGPGRRWMELGHRNVLKFYDVLFRPPALYVVMDYAEGGSVRKALDSCTEDLEVSVVKDWAKQIADGMSYLHSREIVHGGLKAAQILIMEPFDPNNPSPKALKIASYRLTMDRYQSDEVSFKGMFAWMAPEAILGEPTGKASDVWSYGVTVWEMLTKDIPFKDVKQAVLLKDLCEGRTLSVPSHCPHGIRDILNECWEQDKNKRTTFPRIVSRLHAVADIDKNEESQKVEIEEQTIQQQEEESTSTQPQTEVKINFDVIPSFVKTTRTKAAKKDSKAIFGLTVLNGELFVINEHSPDVEVYDSQSLAFKHQFHLEGLYDPVDIESSSKHYCVYIFDWYGESPEILRVASDGKLITKWKTGDDGGYISVTLEANVILSAWDKNLLKEFTADGELLREIQLSASISELRLAIKLPNGHFIISQGEDEESEHRVSLVDEKGTVLKSIGGKQGSSNGEFYSPNYMVVDGSGFILVADQNNRRVVLLSPNLDFEKEVIQAKDDLRYPVRMDLDRTNGRLFVADNDYLVYHTGWRDGRVMAFDFTIHH